MNTKKLRNFIIICFSLLYNLSITANNSISDSALMYTKRFRNATQSLMSGKRKDINDFKDCYQFFKRNENPRMLCACLINMSEIYRQEGQYSKAFDQLWEGLYVAESEENYQQQTRIHQRLADLFDIYAMDESALIHRQQSLRTAKLALAKNQDNMQYVISAFMNMAVRLRTLGNYASALHYLDSCVYYQAKARQDILPYPFLDAERGYIMIKLGRLEEANKHLHRSKSVTDKTTVSYRWNIHFYLGELNRLLSNQDSAIFYYNKSLELFDKQSKNYLLLSDIYLRLSDIYKSRRNMKRAYELLSMSGEVKDSLFNIQKSTHGELFNIKNSYLESIKTKNELLKKQSDEIKHNKIIQSRMKIILTLLILLLAGIILIFRMRFKYRRILLDKKETEMQAQLNEERIKSNLDVKSKELTSYALQLIDKDGAIDDLLNVIENEAPLAYKPLKSKYKKGSQDLWDQFNMRFTDVNSAFYDRLKAKHPELSQTELKHCALIKLNFSTKEMARILNIEVHSVHMSRSRIRRKIGLKREDSLGKYISDL